MLSVGRQDIRKNLSIPWAGMLGFRLLGSTRETKTLPAHGIFQDSSSPEAPRVNFFCEIQVPPLAQGQI